MEKKTPLTESIAFRALTKIFFLSGLWDIIAGFFYTFMIGTIFTDPPTHRFYAIFLATFFFCFAYLQILSSFNMRRYLFIIGAVFIGRVMYVALLFAYIFGVTGFPSTFWWTGVVDLCWSILYIVLALKSGEIRLRDLFLPKKGDT